MGAISPRHYCQEMFPMVIKMNSENSEIWESRSYCSATARVQRVNCGPCLRSTTWVQSNSLRRKSTKAGSREVWNSACSSSDLHLSWPSGDTILSSPHLEMYHTHPQHYRRTAILRFPWQDCNHQFTTFRCLIWTTDLQSPQSFQAL